MIRVTEAIYEKGAFRPLKRPKLVEGQKVKLTIELITPSAVDEMLQLAASVYDGLSAQDIADVEQKALSRQNFFRAPKRKRQARKAKAV